MALADLQVFSSYTYTAMTEVLAQNVDLFNEATNGGLVLKVDAKQGDFSDATFYAAVAGLVRRRNPYGTGAVTEKVMAMRSDVEVKVAAGTPPIRIDPAWYAWILRSPEEAAAAMGQQLAKQTLSDMVNVGIGSVSAALLNTGGIVINDISGGVGGAPPAGGSGTLPSPLALANTAIKLGDYSGDIVCWLMHSKSWNDLYGNALANNERLFAYGTTNVLQDPQGRRYVIADVPGLMVPAVGTGGSQHNAWFHTIGLTPGAVDISQSDDFFDNWSTTNGDENIKRTYQAEWSYSVGVKGFAWDKTNGGKAPNDAALFTGTNWDQVVTSIKDGPGVMLVSQ